MTWFYAAWCVSLVWLTVSSYVEPTQSRRVAVLDALRFGPRPGRELPLRLVIRYFVLSHMEDDGQIVGESQPDGTRIYRLAPPPHCEDCGDLEDSHDRGPPP